MIDPLESLRRAGWTTGELSRRLQIPASTVTGWVRNGYWPQPVADFLIVLAEAVESVPVPQRVARKSTDSPVVQRRERDPDGATNDPESKS